MSYHFNFADNAEYSAADVNKITSRLVTAGVEDPFTDGVSYNLSKFNEAGTLLYTEGVVPETVNTLRVVKAEEEGTVVISPGAAFFHDGAVMEIEDGGHSLSYTAGVKQYVYLKNDLLNTNTCYPVCSVDAPTGDYVLLAEISEKGEITDKRTYAKGKLAGYASNDCYIMKIEDTVTPTGESETFTKTYDIGNNHYTYLLAMTETSSATDRWGCLGIYNFASGTYMSFYGNPYQWYGSFEKLQLYEENSVSADATITVSDGTLTLKIKYLSEFNSSVGPFPITLYLF